MVALKNLVIRVASNFEIIVNKTAVQRNNYRLILCHRLLGIVKNIVKTLGLLLADAKI